MELETHLLIASRLSYLQINELEAVLRQAVGRMLAGWSKNLKNATT